MDIMLSFNVDMQMSKIELAAAGFTRSGASWGTLSEQSEALQWDRFNSNQCHNALLTLALSRDSGAHE